jgi:hypothetical protein
MRINSSGNVGIGTSSPNLNGFGSGTNGLEIADATLAGIRLNGNAADSMYLISGSAKHWVYGRGAVPMTFSTNGAEAMRIDSSGNVGIGTSSPTAKLEIHDDLAKVQIRDTSIAATGVGGILRFQGYTSGTSGANNFAEVKGVKADGTAGGEFVVRTSDTGGSLQERLRIDSSGNVGIGTTSPDYTLDLGGATPVIRIGDAGSIQPTLTRNNSTGGLTYNTTGQSITSLIEFKDNGVERMRIDSSGQLLLGRGANVASGAEATRIQFYNTLSTYDIASIRSLVGAGQVNRGELSFAVNNGAGQQERMRLDYSGNVGIGTTSPDTLLNIASVSAPTLRIENTDTGLTANQTIGDIDFYQNDPSGTGVGVVSKIRSINSSGFQGEAALAFYTGTTGSLAERMRISESGNVGIGATSIDEKLHIEVTGGDAALKLEDAAGGYMRLDQNSLGATNIVRFKSGSSLLERMRIDSSGNLLVGATSTLRSNKFHASSSNFVGGFNVTNGTGEAIAFFSNGTVVGSVSVTGSATAYNTSSDARLKDVTGSARGLEVINKLNPVSYNWKVDGKADEGLIAQEVKELVPNAVSGSEEDMYQMDYSKLVVHLVAGMKEQQTIIESLEARITALES